MGAADLLAHLRGDGFSLDVLNGRLWVTPASRLTDDLRVALRACKTDLVDLLHRVTATDPDQDADIQTAARPDFATRACGQCANQLQYGNCGEPVAAELASSFGIFWAPHGHAEGCTAFAAKASAAARDRPYRMSREQGDVAHEVPWDDPTISLFLARMRRFVHAGLGEQDAEDLAERLTLRDRKGDDRRLCLECLWLGDSGRCIAASTGRIQGADRRHEPVPTILLRCPAFGLRKGLV